MPLVLVVFDDFPPGTVLPWQARSVSPDSSASLGMLASDHSGDDPDVVLSLLEEADREGKLMLLVDCPVAGGSGSSRENMRVETAGDGTIGYIEPPGIAGELEDLDWSDIMERQMAVIRLMEMNLPDLVIVCTTGLPPGEALEVCRIWMEQTTPGRLRVSFYSPPVPGSGRGWAVLAGPGIRNGDVIGMTPLDYLATLRILTGLPWEPSIAQGIPGLAVLSFPPAVLSPEGS
jgi:hypothetical protein